MREPRVVCHACNQEVPPGGVRCGFLINEKARLHAKLVDAERMLRHLAPGLPNLRAALGREMSEARSRLVEVHAMLDAERSAPPTPSSTQTAQQPESASDAGEQKR